MNIGHESVMSGMGNSYNPNPQSLLSMLSKDEQEEAALYIQIAQAVPSEELRKIILHKARKERRMAQRLEVLSQCFGVAPAASPVGPMSYSAGEGKEKK